MRSYHVLVDGASRGKVANGDTLEIALTAGAHRVQMKIDRWFGSREIIVDGSTTTCLQCRTGTNPFFAIFYALFWRNDYILLQRA